MLSRGAKTVTYYVPPPLWCGHWLPAVGGLVVLACLLCSNPACRLSGPAPACPYHPRGPTTTTPPPRAHPGTFERDNRTVFVSYEGGGSHDLPTMRRLLQDNFLEWGPVKSIYIKHEKTIAFVRCARLHGYDMAGGGVTLQHSGALKRPARPSAATKPHPPWQPWRQVACVAPVRPLTSCPANWGEGAAECWCPDPLRGAPWFICPRP